MATIHKYVGITATKKILVNVKLILIMIMCCATTTYGHRCATTALYFLLFLFSHHGHSMFLCHFVLIVHPT